MIGEKMQFKETQKHLIIMLKWNGMKEADDDFN